MDDREVVSAIRARLADRIGNDRYEVWFGTTTQLAVRGETLAVSVVNQFFLDWLRSHFRKDLEAVSSEVVGQPLELEFRIAAPVMPNLIAPPAPIRHAKPEPPCNGHPSPPCHNNGHSGSNAADHNAASHVAVKHHTSVSPAVGRRRPLATLDGFVLGNSNCLAHKAAQMAAEQPGTYSPLLVHGPIGTGKTHLLEGICSAYRRAHPRAGAVYLSAEQFTSHFLESLHGSGMPSFRRKYRGLELLVIDDLQFFKDKRATLVELLHTIDTLLRAGRQLVFASDRPPAALKSLGPELAARLAGGMVCPIEPAEYATRRGIIRQLAIGLSLIIPHDVEAYIASHFTTQSRELAGALQRLKATSLALKRPITLALAEEALSELIDHRVVKLPDIEKAVCDVLGLGPDSLQSSRKTKTVCHPRMLAMWLARKHTRAPLSEIGAYFGRRSHSTVISAHKKIESRMAGGSTPELAEGARTLEETIRRVEEQLRVG